MKVLFSINGFSFHFGGQSHSGWLPGNASEPLPVQVQSIILDLEIQSDESGYLLVYKSHDGSVFGDTWHQSIHEAQKQALSQFGIAPSKWHSV